jgi:peptidoglycan hydrolase CwlO-like protein
VILQRKGVALGLLAVAFFGRTAISHAQQPHAQQLQPGLQTQVDQINQTLSTVITSLKGVNETLDKTKDELTGLKQQVGQEEQKVNAEDKKIQSIKEITPEESPYL